MKFRTRISASLLLMMLFHGCATSWVKPPETRPIQGIASWYGEEFAGRVTASGEIFDPMDLTAAHRALPFGTVAMVINVKTGETVEVRINDRGPYVGKRIIDLSYAAAQRIGLVQPGIGLVELKVIALGDGKRTRGTAPQVSPGPQEPGDQPPAVPFPLPAEVRSPTVAKLAQEESEFEIEVVEVHAGTVAKRRVSADGRDIETFAPDGSRVPPPPPPVPEQFFLQLGAFQSDANAEALRQRAAEVTRSVFIEESMGFYRVRVGPFTSRDRALRAQQDLDKANLPSLLLNQ
jgi:rare lipoprotein A